MSRDNNMGYGLVMFLLGAATGAAVALLYAPQEGAETRRLLGEKTHEYGDRVSEMTSSATQTAKEKLHHVSDVAQEKLHQVTDKAQEMLNRGKQQGQEMANNASDAAQDALSRP